MYIWIDCDGAGPELREPDVFTELKLVVAGAADLEAAGREAARVGRTDDGHVFVEPALLRRLAAERAGDVGWSEQFEGMVEYASAKGWIDDAGNVRAHIELS
jgi:hypothetical protein